MTGLPISLRLSEMHTDILFMGISSESKQIDIPAPLLAAAFVLFGAFAGATGAVIFGVLGAFLGGILAAAAAYGIVLAWQFARGLQSATPTVPAAAEAITPEIAADRTDSLTGLANENGLMAWFADRGPRLASDGMGLVVLVAKLEDFAKLEASRGREVADSILKEIAIRVSVVSGSEGIAARTNGDEFASVVVVVPAHAQAVAAERAGHLVELISRPVEHPSGAIWIGGSVGGATGSPDKGPEILAAARAALAAASRKGRNQYVVAKAD